MPVVLEKGDIDMARNLTPDQIKGVKGNEGIAIDGYPKGTLVYMAANAAHPILGKPEVAQAIRNLVENAIRETYDGPLDLAKDFMVWNVTKEAIRTRMGVPNHDSYPAPPQRATQPPDSMKAYQWTEFSLSGIEPESAAVTNAVIEAFNERNNTSVKPSLTGLPFQKKQ